MIDPITESTTRLTPPDHRLTQQIQSRDPNELKPHQLNASIYELFNEESEQFKDLVKSIIENGVQEPLIVKDDGTILSGHRRWQVAKKLKLSGVPCVPPIIDDDRLVIIESNRYRRKSTSELMREAEILETIEKEKAERRIKFGVPEGESARSVRDVISAEIGMKPRSYSKVRQIYEAAKTNENARAELTKIDKGEKSIDAAFKSLRPLLSGDRGGEDAEIPDFIQFTTAWRFAENDPRFGVPHPGRIPGQIAGNLIYYYTEPDDLVVDPMAGGGSTLDAAEFLGRQAAGFDLHPVRPDIEKWDISEGFPPDAEGAQLIFMDPPYWNMKAEDYKVGSSSDLSQGDFIVWLRQLISSASYTVRVGGFVATIIMPQYFRLPDNWEGGYIDWPFEVFMSNITAGLTPWSRFSCAFPISLFTAFDVERAKTERSFLPLVADIVVARRLR